MLGIILRFLPRDKRLLLQLLLRITSSLDTAEERKDVAEYGTAILKTGKITIADLSKLGSKLGILTGKH